ncbi:MAG: ATP-binding cassette domain-containing protein [Dermatophilaceae bacterium]
MLTSVTAGYLEGAPAVTELSLTIPSSGITRLHGPNGAGKSTVVELLSGYLRPWSGSVTVLGEDAGTARASRYRRVMRTSPALFAQMTVHDHLAVFAKATGEDPQVMRGRASRLGLDAWVDANAGSLSSGSAKKLWYVLCTSGDPRVVIVDEPFNAVDDTGIDTIVEELCRWRSAGRTIVVVCHTVPPGLVVDHMVNLPTATDSRPACG